MTFRQKINNNLLIILLIISLTSLYFMLTGISRTNSVRHIFLIREVKVKSITNDSLKKLLIFKTIKINFLKRFLIEIFLFSNFIGSLNLLQSIKASQSWTFYLKQLCRSSAETNREKKSKKTF